MSRWFRWPLVWRKTYDQHLLWAFQSRDAAHRAYEELCATLPPPTHHGIPLFEDRA